MVVCQGKENLRGTNKQEGKQERLKMGMIDRD